MNDDIRLQLIQAIRSNFVQSGWTDFHRDDVQVLLEEIDRLQAALDAPRVRLLPDAPCPVCGQTFQLSVETNAQCRAKGVDR